MYQNRLLCYAEREVALKSNRMETNTALKQCLKEGGEKLRELNMSPLAFLPIR